MLHIMIAGFVMNKLIIFLLSVFMIFSASIVKIKRFVTWKKTKNSYILEQRDHMRRVLDS